MNELKVPTFLNVHVHIIHVYIEQWIICFSNLQKRPLMEQIFILLLKKTITGMQKILVVFLISR